MGVIFPGISNLEAKSLFSMICSGRLFLAGLRKTGSANARNTNGAHVGRRWIQMCPMLLNRETVNVSVSWVLVQGDGGIRSDEGRYQYPCSKNYGQDFTARTILTSKVRDGGGFGSMNPARSTNSRTLADPVTKPRQATLTSYGVRSRPLNWKAP